MQRHHTVAAAGVGESPCVVAGSRVGFVIPGITAASLICEIRVICVRNGQMQSVYTGTAVFVGVSIRVSAALGALSVGASREEVDRMRKFGEAIGIAFQIQDDILDYNRQNNTGKPANNDLREHKITLPLIEVMERKTAEERMAIIELVKRCDKEEGAVDELQRIVDEGEGTKYAAQTMQAYIQRALHLLSKYPDSPYRAALIELCAFIAERDR